MATYVDKIRCFECNATLLRKNLKQHYLRHHHNIPPKFRSLSTIGIDSFFRDGSEKRPSSEIEQGETISDEQNEICPNFKRSKSDGSKNEKETVTARLDNTIITPEITQLPSSSVQSPIPASLESPGTMALLQELLKQFSGLSERIVAIEKRNAEGACRQEPLTSTIIGEVTSDDLTTEERKDLLINSRSIDRLIKWSGCFSRCTNGLLCNYCGTALSYDYSVGDSFPDTVLPDCFRHLKYDLKRHIESSNHILNVQAHNAESEKQKYLIDSGKVNALNCANAAYLSYKNNMSYKAFEDLITVMHNSGCSVGVKNHSKEFPRLFLPMVHSVLKKEVSSYILDNDLPVGVVADKVTVHHRSRHVIGLRVPVFDINRENLFQCIYLEHNFVDNFTGHGLASSILNTLDKFDFCSLFLRKNLVGLAVDGQYIKLGVTNHIKNELALEKLIVNWDQMHQIELAQKHSDVPNIINIAHSLIHDSMKEFMFGSKYEQLLKCSEDFGDFFYRPKLFKTMKFASYSKEVFRTFIGDYKFLVTACEGRPNMFALRDKLLTKSIMFHILILFDLYNILSKYSKCVQKVNNLPWEYLQYMNNLGSDLEIFSWYIETICNVESVKELCDKIATFPSAFFSHTKTSTEMFLLSTYQGVPLPDLPVSSKILRSNNNESYIYKNFSTDMTCIVKFVMSLIENLAFYRNEESDNLLKKTDHLFNFEYLCFPQTNVSVDQLSEYKGFDCETFNEYAQSFPFYSVIAVDQQTLWFEWKQLWLWFNKTACDHRAENMHFDIKRELKLAVLQLKEKLPSIIKFVIFCISIPVSEAVCESWGSVINHIMDKRTRARDGEINDIGTTDMRVFITINGPPAGYKSVRKLLKAALIKKYGINYYTHFQNISTSVAMQNSIKSKVVSRILEDDTSILPCFK